MTIEMYGVEVESMRRVTTYFATLSQGLTEYQLVFRRTEDPAYGLNESSIHELACAVKEASNGKTIKRCPRVRTNESTVLGPNGKLWTTPEKNGHIVAQEADPDDYIWKPYYRWRL
jgi:hypothetical protein